MSKVTIYHNPRCSKSRQTLKLLEQRGIEPQVVLYLDDPPSAETLNGILEMLNLSPSELVRQKDFRELGLNASDDPQETVRQMVAHPKIIERPIVVSGKSARIGRPPESVLEIL